MSGDGKGEAKYNVTVLGKGAAKGGASNSGAKGGASNSAGVPPAALGVPTMEGHEAWDWFCEPRVAEAPEWR